ncbi:serine hydrolase [Parahaliea maris]|uniref:Serine hydrolase n=1 Tax=Parahaliea maris TaxID=2716870 RepID=A0A5C9A3W3_9GAMM|nr:serine hydrolase [Parahaliea maris]TXS93991.1 serine hydrolase [Parahaliea maris]
MRKVATVGVLLCGLVLLLWWAARPALQVAVGYTAKQLCSGILVSGLPLDAVWARDVAPRMAIIGPLRGALRQGVQADAGGVSSRFLGVSARAEHRREAGCTLFGEPASPPKPAGDFRWAGATDAPEDGPFADALDAAFGEPGGGGRNTLAVLVSHRGQLVGERYRPPVSPATRLQGWSMNKSLMATWVGLQVQRGDLSLDSPVADALRAEGRDDLAGAVDPGLNLGHLLHMESGLGFEETYAPGDDATRMLYRSRAMWAVAPATGQAYSPGEHFSYSSGDTNVASMIWQRSLGERGYRDWLADNFSGPLGLQHPVYEADASGVQVGSSYTYLRGRDWLRVGQLWLDAWHGRSDVLSQAWQRAAVTPRPSSRDGQYGRGFWLNTAGASFSRLPETLFYASGNGSQAVVVFPEQELVVVRLGLTTTGVDSGLESLLEAVFSEHQPVVDAGLGGEASD